MNYASSFAAIFHIKMKILKGHKLSFSNFFKKGYFLQRSVYNIFIFSKLSELTFSSD